MDLSHITINFIKKDFGIKGEDNIEVNFIEMMKDSAENGTVYKRVDNGIFYKVEDNELKYSATGQHYPKVEGTYPSIVSSMYVKVEQYKEITAEEAIKALILGKEIELKRCITRYKVCTLDDCIKMYEGDVNIVNSVDNLLMAIIDKNSKFYIKE